MNTVGLVICSYNGCADTMKCIESLLKQSWRDFVIGIDEPELIQYLKERQLYVNDEIVSEEEQ